MKIIPCKSAFSFPSDQSCLALLRGYCNTQNVNITLPYSTWQVILVCYHSVDLPLVPGRTDMATARIKPLPKDSVCVHSNSPGTKREDKQVCEFS